MTQEKTSLKKIIDERGITLYKIIKRLGANPRSNYGHYADKVNGRSKVTKEQLADICKAIEEETNQPLNPNDLNLKVEVYTIV